MNLDEIIRSFESKLRLITGNDSVSINVHKGQPEGDTLSLELSTVAGNHQWSAPWTEPADGTLKFLGSALDELRTKMEKDLIKIAAK